MIGIAGITETGKNDLVNEMLQTIAHRGDYGKKIIEKNHTTVGFIWPKSQSQQVETYIDQLLRSDTYLNKEIEGVGFKDKEIVLFRDELGVFPLYYGLDEKKNLCFASEVKALLKATPEIKELQPGHRLIGNKPQEYFRLKSEMLDERSPEEIAIELKSKIENVVKRQIGSNTVGSWLSGGLDSSVIASMVRKNVKNHHTFSIGVKDSPDILYAEEVANFLKTEHRQLFVTIKDLIEVLPRVIYHLESFDALLVRSSVMNYLVAQLSSSFVSEVFSGEVGDEIFAGYHYLKTIPEEELSGELIDITNRLHNTALQRVDRCAAAFGLTVHVPFAEPDIFKFALKIPARYKIYNGTEKWILRKAFEGELPQNVLIRPKEKFWQGAGVGQLLADYASNTITDQDFNSKKLLPNGWILNSKEELMYYNIFRDHFGSVKSLDWMGRTKK